MGKSTSLPNLWHVCIAWPNGENSADTFATTVEANSYDEAVKACIEEMHDHRVDNADDEALDYDEYDSPIDCYPLHEGIVRDLASYGINKTFPEIIAALSAPSVPIVESRKISPLEFLNRLERAHTVKLPGVGKVAVTTAAVEGKPENQIAYLSWYGPKVVTFAAKVTEQNITDGWMQGDGSFRGTDDEGDPLLIMFDGADGNPLPFDAPAIRAKTLEKPVDILVELESNIEWSDSPEAMRITLDQPTLNRLVELYLAARQLKGVCIEQYHMLGYQLLKRGEADEDVWTDAIEETHFPNLRLNGVHISVNADGNVQCKLLLKHSDDEIWGDLCNIKEYIDGLPHKLHLAAIAAPSQESP
jgi:hypothetical protein